MRARLKRPILYPNKNNLYQIILVLFSTGKMSQSVISFIASIYCFTQSVAFGTNAIPVACQIISSKTIVKYN